MTQGAAGECARRLDLRAEVLKVSATHRIVEDSTMDTRRLRDHSRSVAAFRWLGWVMLMMFVLVQAVQATPFTGG